MSFIAAAIGIGGGALAGGALGIGAGAGALIGGSLASSIIGSNAASSAANTQANAATQATNAQLGMFNTVMGNLQPYMKAGTSTLGTLQDLLSPGGSLLHNFNASDLNANLAPNYQFQLGQGLGQVQNAGAPGGMTGNTLAGMNAFAQDYASNAYQQAFQNYVTNQNNIFSRLGTLAQLGQASSTGTASGAPLFSSGISQSIQGVGAAQAAGRVGVANALTGGVNNALGYYTLANMGGGSLFGGGNGGYNPNSWNFNYLPSGG